MSSIKNLAYIAGQHRLRGKTWKDNSLLLPIATCYEVLRRQKRSAISDGDLQFALREHIAENISRRNEYKPRTATLNDQVEEFVEKFLELYKEFYGNEFNRLEKAWKDFRAAYLGALRQYFDDNKKSELTDQETEG